MLRNRWTICAGVKEAIHRLIPERSVILEFGSGQGSVELSEMHELHSVEHDPQWVGHAEKASYIHAPIIDIEPIFPFSHESWYDSEAILSAVPVSIDLILVDGPTGKIGRSGLLGILNRLPQGAIWIIDDTLRTEESELSRQIAYTLRLHETRFWNFSILSDKPISIANLRAIRAVSDEVLNMEEEDYLDQFFTRRDDSE
jgi:hypothetical protein